MTCDKLLCRFLLAIIPRLTMQKLTRRSLWLLLTGITLLLAGCVTPALTSTPDPVCLPTATSTPLPGTLCYLAATPTSTPTIEISSSDKKLVCENILSMQWGAGPDELGYVVIEGWKNVSGPYPPVFDEQGIMYVADPVNNRILRFTNIQSPDVIPIPASYTLDYNETTKIRWSNVSISDEHIILKYSAWKDRIVERLAVLNVKGEEEKIIELDLLYPLRSIFSSPIIPDRKGGFYYLVEPLGMIYFDADLHSDLLDMGSNWPYTDTVVGWDQNLYSYSNSEDRLFSWGESGNVRLTQLQPAQAMEGVSSKLGIDEGWGRLIGVDKNGIIHMLFTDDDENQWLLRFSMSGDQIEKALVPNEISNRLILAPDNSYYILSYGVNSAVEPPIVVKCTLK